MTPFDRFLGREHGSWRLTRWDLLILLLGYGLLIIMYFGPHAFADRALAAPGSDMFTDWIWKRAQMGNAFRQGRLPILNPYIMGSVPVLASGQSALFYPPNWLFGLIPAVVLINAQIMFHFWAGLAATHLMARRMGRSLLASIIAALVFGFSGFAILHWWQGHLPFVMMWPWTPLAVILWIEIQQRAQETLFRVQRLLPPVLLLAGVIALQFFVGQPQITYLTVLILGILHAGWAAWVATRRGERRMLLRPLLWGTGALAAAAVAMMPLIAVQFLPTLEYVEQTFRGYKLPQSALTMFSLPPAQTSMLVAPWSFGGPGTIPYLDSPVHFRSLHEAGCYVGATTIVLAMASLLLGRGLGFPLRLTLAAMALFSWVMALGEHTPVYGIMLKLMPGLSMFRAPGRFAFLMAFAFGLLAAFGLDGLRAAAAGSPEASRRFKKVALTLLAFLAAGAGLFALLFARGPASPLFRAMLSDQIFRTPDRLLPEEFYRTYFVQYSSSMAAAALVAVLVAVLILLMAQQRLRPVIVYLIPAVLLAELFLFASRLQGSTSVTDLTWPIAVRRHLVESGPRWRLGSNRLSSDLCQGMSVGVRHIWGVDPLMPYHYTMALLISQEMDKGQYASQNMPQVRSNPFTRAMAMRWILLPENYPLAGTGWRPVLQVGGCLIAEDPFALPRGYTVDAALTIPEDTPVVRAVNADDFHPTRTVLLSDPVPAGAPAQDIATSTAAPLHSDPPGTVTILADEAEHFAARVEMTRPGWFVLMDQLLPGWSATVNGTPAKLYQANAVGRTLPLEAGTSQIEMTYRAPGFRAGAWVSGIALALWAAALALAYRVARVSQK